MSGQTSAGTAQTPPEDPPEDGPVGVTTLTLLTQSDSAC
jgi:hypothetical protein